MVVDTQNRYADDITVQELVRLQVENEKLKKQVETLRHVVSDQHDFSMKMEKQYRDALAKYE